MDPRCVYLQKHQVPELIDQLIAKLVEAQPSNPRQYLANQLVAVNTTGYTAHDFVPSSEYSNALAPTVLDEDTFIKYRTTQTSAGFTLDDCIRDGLDHGTAGRTPEAGALPLAGISPTDVDCFVTFADVFEAVIEMRHGVAFQARAAPFYVQDVSIGKVRGGFSFDERRVRSVVCKLRRNVSGYLFATAITRPERRELEHMLSAACQTFTGANAGRIYPVAHMPHELPTKPRNAPLLLPQYYASPLRSCYREWPDARSVFIADDNAAAAQFNCGSEHIEVVAVGGQGNNIREAFDRCTEWMGLIEENIRTAGKELAAHPRLGALTADLDYIGSGMTLEATVDAPHLSAHPKLTALLKRVKLSPVTDWATNPQHDIVLPAAATTGASAKPDGADDAGDNADDEPADASVMLKSRRGLDGDGARQSDVPPLRLRTNESLSASPIEVLQRMIEGLTKLLEAETALEKAAANSHGHVTAMVDI